MSWSTPPFREPKKHTIQPRDAFEDTAFQPEFEIVNFSTRFKITRPSFHLQSMHRMICGFVWKNKRWELQVTSCGLWTERKNRKKYHLSWFIKIQPRHASSVDDLVVSKQVKEAWASSSADSSLTELLSTSARFPCSIADHPDSPTASPVRVQSLSSSFWRPITTSSSDYEASGGAEVAGCSRFKTVALLPPLMLLFAGCGSLRGSSLDGLLMVGLSFTTAFSWAEDVDMETTAWRSEDIASASVTITGCTEVMQWWIKVRQQTSRDVDVVSMNTVNKEKQHKIEPIEP